ncbi:MAG: hypothetical protein WC505_07100 [Patescibacteria group bacterium]
MKPKVYISPDGHQVEAIQFPDDSEIDDDAWFEGARECLRFIGFDRLVKVDLENPDEGIVFSTGGNDNAWCAWPGSWIVRDTNYRYRVMNDIEFTANYRPRGEG